MNPTSQALRTRHGKFWVRHRVLAVNKAGVQTDDEPAPITKVHAYEESNVQIFNAYHHLLALLDAVCRVGMGCFTREIVLVLLATFNSYVFVNSIKRGSFGRIGIHGT